MKNIVIIPTYNEKENIEAIVSAVMNLEEVEFDVLIVDDNSPDCTASIVKDMQKNNSRLFLIEREGKLGLGSAYLTGFRWALEHGYDTISEMDADFSHNPNDLIQLHRAITSGADVAIGSRYVKGISVVNWSFSRILLSYCASLYVRLITGIKVKDTTAGFVCYRATALSKIVEQNIVMVGYGFQIEMKYAAWKLGFAIKEVSIIFTDRKLGTSKMSGGIFSEALLGVIKMRFRTK